MEMLSGIPIGIWLVIGVVFVGIVVGLLYLKDRGKKETAEPVVVAQAQDGSVLPKPVGRLRAYYWTKDNGIVLTRIPKPIGSLWTADTTMPEPGSCYLVRTEKGELGDTDFIPYDPRKEPMVEDERPQRAYDATHCKGLVNNVYSTPMTMWDKFNAILPYGAAFLFFIVILVGIDKL